MVPMFAAIVIIYEFLARWVGFKSFETWIMNGKKNLSLCLINCHNLWLSFTNFYHCSVIFSTFDVNL